MSRARFLAYCRRQSVVAGCASFLAGAAVVANALYFQPEQPLVMRSAASAADAPSADPLVRAVQAELSQRGAYEGPLDGLPGPQTREAIRAFEQEFGRAPTGEASEALLTLLRKPQTARNLETPQAVAAPPAPFDPQVAVVQSALSRSAYGPLKADGYFGPQTREAIVRFQADHALPATGTISDALIVELRAVGALED